jgi:hypothetical protein
VLVLTLVSVLWAERAVGDGSRELAAVSAHVRGTVEVVPAPEVARGWFIPSAE